MMQCSGGASSGTVQHIAVSSYRGAVMGDIVAAAASPQHNAHSNNC